MKRVAAILEAGCFTPHPPLLIVVGVRTVQEAFYGTDISKRFCDQRGPT